MPLPLACMEFVDMDCKVYVDENELPPKIAMYGCYLSEKDRSALTSKPYILTLADGRILIVDGDVTLYK